MRMISVKKSNRPVIRRLQIPLKLTTMLPNDDGVRELKAPAQESSLLRTSSSVSAQKFQGIRGRPHQRL